MKGNINNKQFQYFKILDGGSLCEKKTKKRAKFQLIKKRKKNSCT